MLSIVEQLQAPGPGAWLNVKINRKPPTDSGLTFHPAFIFTSITVKNKSKPSSVFIPVGKIPLQTQLLLRYSQAIERIFNFTLEEHTQPLQ